MQKRRISWLAILLIMVLLVGCGQSAQTQNTGDVQEGQQTAESQETDGNSENMGDDSQQESEKAEDSKNAEESEKADDSQKDTEESNPEETSQEQEDAQTEGENTKEQEELAGAESDAVEESAPATLNPDTVVYTEEEVSTTSSVNIRTRPSTDSEVYRVAARRETFTRTANDGEWSAVTVDGAEYYISSQYLMLASEVTDNGYLVVIDAGHQGQGNHGQEPIGPGASETKAKVASGTTGVSTGIPEYQLTLSVSLKLRDELEARGYQVMMIREKHDINISNAERAQTANSAGADAFIRVHANGSDDSSQNGILTICQTPSNPYNGSLYQQCRTLSDCVLDGMINATGANRKSVWETDSMSGINWCQVPVTIVEMGFMSNPAEDELMATESYQYQLAVGMADGIDVYFGR